MSTISTNPTAPVAAARDDDGLDPARGPLPLVAGRPADPDLFGLSPATWLKIGVLAALVVAVYWRALLRIWLITNPINGAGNWEHAVFIPLIGLYFLYLRRDDLLGSAARPDGPAAADADRWHASQAWWLLMGLPPLLLAAAATAWGVARFLADDAVMHAAETAGLVVAGAWPLFAVGAGAWAFVRRAEIARFADTQRWLDDVWRGLGVCVMALVAFGRWPLLAGLILGQRAGVPTLVAAGLVAVGLLAMLTAVLVLAGRRDDAWRSKLSAAIRTSPVWLGAPVTLFGLGLSATGHAVKNPFLGDLGMVEVIFGLTLMVGRWRVMRVAWFPIVFLYCALPLPDQLYAQIALPLQRFAAKVAFYVLNTGGVRTDLTGTRIILEVQGRDYPLNVAEACSGLKSLMTFVSVAATIAFLSQRPLWQKLLLTASAVPIAIGCNAMRVSVLGLLAAYVNKEWSQNFAHAFVGLLMLIPGLLIMLGLWWLLDAIFIEEADPAAKAAGAGGVAAGATTSSKPTAAKRIIIPRKPAVAPAAATVAAAQPPAAAARNEPIAPDVRPSAVVPQVSVDASVKPASAPAVAAAGPAPAMASANRGSPAPTAPAVVPTQASVTPARPAVVRPNPVRPPAAPASGAPSAAARPPVAARVPAAPAGPA
ncbi:MAG TPA: exosortase/archaeosortase family protein, partial [Humisphaera sp.]